MSIFRRNKLKATIRRIDREFQSRTANVSDNVWGMRDFCMLLNLADNAKLGKSKAIIYAIKIGYLTCKKELTEKIMNGFAKKEDGE